jgi:hypothetical protein
LPKLNNMSHPGISTNKRKHSHGCACSSKFHLSPGFARAKSSLQEETPALQLLPLEKSG